MTDEYKEYELACDKQESDLSMLVDTLKLDDDHTIYSPLDTFPELQIVIEEISAGCDIKKNLEAIMESLNCDTVPDPSDLLLIFPQILDTIENNSEDQDLLELCFAILVFLSHANFESECPFLDERFGQIPIRK